MSHAAAEITSDVFKSGGHSYKIAYASATKSRSSKNDDVIALKEQDGEVSILLADGATGFGFGHVAAQALSDYFQSSYESQATSRKAKRFLIDADEAVRQACAGEAEGADTTGIVLSLLNGRIEGASAGDSQAIVFGSSTYQLTGKQRRKPRIGNGAYAEDFTGRIAPGDVMVVASDGLWNRVKLDHVSKAVLTASGLDQAVAKLLSMARTSAGKFDDDVSVVCVSLA
ncbi:SpoIIE family protein phosphatase [Rhizobium sp. BK176]|uniref:SpoIIE family protein phosphatase n=1 Tax=Rhizobium sp. BK176 TaxID=2587071 RepID=UPI002167CE9A|nr:SpoIIE family protein phosphatase [Rhizobium sp. BK176]MCS4089701.1 serine/threonine protein phosphatase PrpC [Rhizobium sp. BK176]